MTFRMIALTLIVLVTVAGVGARMALADDAGAPATNIPGLTSLSASAASSDAASESSPVEQALPYVTEGGFFAIVGFALGYASRKLLKLMLIVIAVFFAGVQGLAALDVVAVDWDKAVALANDFVLNIKQDQSWLEIFKDKLPTTGGLAAGYALGFRRG